ncbi:unnamed protein product [Spirodela intermedia]|uniref:Cation efflux protein transmembrane domain-containing protein n=1 Tax=Spirodela intermedia TaxID=51605 RepID=A0A7I8JR17_SPIIN|nr:unnamed protein product [Spirodela intermedia]CAA6672594.1 unnamed protein product [Spirodela intermedia]
MSPATAARSASPSLPATVSATTPPSPRRPSPPLSLLAVGLLHTFQAPARFVVLLRLLRHLRLLPPLFPALPLLPPPLSARLSSHLLPLPLLLPGLLLLLPPHRPLLLPPPLPFRASSRSISPIPGRPPHPPRRQIAPPRSRIPPPLPGPPHLRNRRHHPRRVLRRHRRQIHLSLFRRRRRPPLQPDRRICRPCHRRPPPLARLGSDRMLPDVLLLLLRRRRMSQDSPSAAPLPVGVLGFYESSACNWPPLRNLGRRRLRLVSLGLTTALLFFPALVGFIVSEGRAAAASPWGTLAGLWRTPSSSASSSPETLPKSSSPHCQRSPAGIPLHLTLHFRSGALLQPRLSLPGFLLSALLLWISVDQLASSSSSWSPLELENPDAAESFASMAARPLRHIWSERKSRKIAMFLLINSAYMVVEFTVGFLSNSLGLISDACHMLFDCAALGIGLYASYISRLPASAQFNYGRGRFEVVSGYVNASFERILDPQEISTSSLLSVSIGGLLVNVVGLVFFHEEHHHAHGGGACSHSHSESDHRHHHHHHHHGCTTGGRPSELDHPAAQQSDTGKVFFQEEHHHATVEELVPTHSESDHHHHGCTTGGRPSELDHHSTRQSKSRRDAGHHHRSHDDHSNDHHGCVTGGQPSELDHRATRHSKSSQDTDHHHHSHNDHCNDHPAEQWTGINFKDLSEHDHDHGGGQEHEHCGHSHGSEKRMESMRSSSKLTRGKPAEEPQRRHVVDHNMEGIFLHVLADTMGSVGVVISTLLIKYKGWLVADPACSILISVMIVSSVVPLLRNSAEILLQRTPRTREWDIKEAIEDIARMKGICGVDRYHVWNFTTSDIVGTIHLRVSADCDMVLAREQVSQKLQQAGVKDLTIQLEYV